MNKKYRDPQRDKELDYENYHFSPGKSDKGFRRTWRRKKSRGHRIERRKVNQLLHNTSSDYDDSVSVEASTHNLKLDKPVKWATMTLREKVAFKKCQRKRMYHAKIKRRIRSNIQVR